MQAGLSPAGSAGRQQRAPPGPAAPAHREEHLLGVLVGDVLHHQRRAPVLARRDARQVQAVQLVLLHAAVGLGGRVHGPPSQAPAQGGVGAPRGGGAQPQPAAQQRSGLLRQQGLVQGGLHAGAAAGPGGQQPAGAAEQGRRVQRRRLLLQRRRRLLVLLQGIGVPGQGHALRPGAATPHRAAAQRLVLLGPERPRARDAAQRVPPAAAAASRGHAGREGQQVPGAHAAVAVAAAQLAAQLARRVERHLAQAPAHAGQDVCRRQLPRGADAHEVLLRGVLLLLLLLPLLLLLRVLLPVLPIRVQRQCRPVLLHVLLHHGRGGAHVPQGSRPSRSHVSVPRQRGAQQPAGPGGCVAGAGGAPGLQHHHQPAVHLRGLADALHRGSCSRAGAHGAERIQFPCC